MLRFRRTEQAHTAYSTSAMAIEHSRNMETRDHSNGVSPKNQRSRGNELIKNYALNDPEFNSGQGRIMRKFVLFFVAAMLLSMASVFAQGGTTGPLTWNLNDGTLTISGEGEMPNCGWWGSEQPWYEFRESIHTSVIESGVTSIGEFAFIDCINLSSIIISNSVTDIRSWAFVHCYSLTSIDIPNLITIEEHVFDDCNSLSSITIPQTVTSIGGWAFRKTALTTLNIPEGVTSIGNYAFEGCNKLTDVYVEWTAPLSVPENIFLFVATPEINLHVPEGSEYAYDDTPVWQNFNIVGLPCPEDYENVRESEHFIFEIPCIYLKHHISPANLQRWLSHLDAIYEAYAELVGGVPCNGEKIRIVKVSGVSYWAAAHIGGCEIFWNSSYITSTLDKIDEFDDWNFGILHEIGHLFDKPSEPNWIYHAESTATFKAFYALDVIPDCQFELRGLKTSLQEMYDDIYGLLIQYEGEDDLYIDKITLTFINIAQLYGWEAFKQAYHSYWNDSYPVYNCAIAAEKYNNFVDRLEYFSGSSDIRSECFYEDWLETIERHYPRDIYQINTWEIGYPNAADVIATLESGTLTISGTGAMQDGNGSDIWRCREIIEVVIEHGVTSIGNVAFEWCSSLSSVSISETVTSIGSWAFAHCHSLTSIIIPNSVDTIKAGVFEDCSNLASVIMGNNVKTIGYYAFKNCNSLVYAAIPSSVTSIGGEAFSNCHNLSSINIPDAVTSIGGCAFGYCFGLTDVTVNWNTPLSVPSNTFVGVSNVDLHVPAGTECAYAAAPVWQNFNFPVFNNSWIIGYPNGCDVIATLENNTLTISGTGAMKNFAENSPPWRYLLSPNTTVNIEEGVTTIGNNAFRNCANLSFVNFPSNSITSIGNDAFRNSGLTSLELPNSLTTIGNSAFRDCSNLAGSLTIPNSVISIGGRAFCWCRNLKGSLTLSHQLTTIEEGTFDNCDFSGTLSIPNSVVSIGNFAFSWCRYFTSVIIPNSVNSIGSEAFHSYNSLTDVTVYWDTPLLVPTNIFNNTNVSNVNLHVPACTQDLYAAEPVWQDFNIVGSCQIYHEDDKEGLRSFLRQLSAEADKINAEQLGLTVSDTLNWQIDEEWVNKIVNLTWNTEVPKRLTQIGWGDKNLTGTLNASIWKKLEVLDCYGNQLTAIELGADMALWRLDCGGNQLTELDVSANSKLRDLRCHTNKLTALNLSTNTLLQMLLCYNNQLTELDVSANAALTIFECFNNRLLLSDLFAVSEILKNNGTSVENRRLGKQHILPQTVDIGVELDYSSQNELLGIPTVFSVTQYGQPVFPGNFTITNGIITFHTVGIYTVKMTNEAIISSPNYPAEVILYVIVGIDPETCIDESEHFILDIAHELIPITPCQVADWLACLDRYYDQLTDLMSGLTPFGGDKITIRSVDEISIGYAWARAGNPITWNNCCGFIPETLNKFALNGDWSFGILHEIGHNFGRYIGNGNNCYNWNEEMFANFRMYLAFIKLPDAMVNMDGFCYGTEFWDINVQEDYNTNGPGGNKAIEAGLDWTLARIGIHYQQNGDRGYWLYKQAFEIINSTPYCGNACTKWEQFNYFLDILSSCAGSDVRETYTVQELSLIETALGGNTATWEIGFPNATDVIATFENNTLTIEGIGAVQDFSYNHTSLPWYCAKDRINSIVINSDVTTIGRPSTIPLPQPTHLPQLRDSVLPPPQLQLR
ncbi:MAG: leucine-rich repeat protein [Bacteroidales bacterium]|nr:leucine-rich repeat protein [Bacteroidales bacterium]